MARARIVDDRVTSFDPLTGAELGSFDVASPVRVAEAASRCREASAAWAETPIKERCKALRRALDLMLERSDELVRIASRETGQCEAAVRFNQAFGLADLFRYYIDEFPGLLAPRKLKVSALDFPGARAWVDKVPLGVVGVIMPWNYPWSLPVRSIVPALLAGNGVLFKPSEHTCLTGQAVAEVFQASLPEGVLEVVHGAGSTGAAICAGDVDCVLFTGSVRTGRLVAEECGRRFVPFHLELGGKDAALVLPDCDPDRSALGITWGALTNSGQDCSSIERVYVAEGIWDAFRDRIKAAVDRVTVYTEGAEVWDIGPAITAEQDEIVREHLAEARERGAELIAGTWPEPDDAFVGPIAVAVEDESLKLVSEETFGPVLPLVKVKDAEEGLRRANDCPYGLQFSVWTTDYALGRDLCRRAEAGVTKINGTSWVATVPGSVWGGPGWTGGAFIGGPDMASKLTRSVSRVEVKTKGLAANWLPMDEDAAEISKARLIMDKPGLGSTMKALSGLIPRIGKRLKSLQLP